MEDMPGDLCSPGLKGPELSERKEQNWEKGTDVGRNCRGPEAKKQGHGKQRQEVFSGSSEKSGNKEASQDSGRGVGGTSKFRELGPENSWQLQGLEEGCATVSSANSVALDIR